MNPNMLTEEDLQQEGSDNYRPTLEEQIADAMMSAQGRVTNLGLFPPVALLWSDEGSAVFPLYELPVEDWARGLKNSCEAFDASQVLIVGSAKKFKDVEHYSQLMAGKTFTAENPKLDVELIVVGKRKSKTVAASCEYVMRPYLRIGKVLGIVPVPYIAGIQTTVDNNQIEWLDSPPPGASTTALANLKLEDAPDQFAVPTYN